MANAKFLGLAPKLNILLWSPSGKGKSTFAATFRKAGKIYFFECDGRIEVLAGQDIDYDFYPRAGSSYAAANAKLAEFEAQVIAGKFDLSAVVLDSFDMFQEFVMMHVMPLVKAVQSQTRRIGVEDKKDFKTGLTIPGLQLPSPTDYHACQKFCENFLARLVALPCHVIVIGHETVDTEELTQKKFINIDAIGKLASRIFRYFNEVWRMDIVSQIIEDDKGKKTLITEKHVLITRPTTQLNARTAYRKYLAEHEEPDFEIIWKKITEGLLKDLGPQQVLDTVKMKG